MSDNDDKGLGDALKGVSDRAFKSVYSPTKPKTSAREGNKTHTPREITLVAEIVADLLRMDHDDFHATTIARNWGLVDYNLKDLKEMGVSDYDLNELKRIY